MFVLQQLLSLQDKLRSKEAELEQASEEQRCLEGQVHALQQVTHLQLPQTPG